MLDTVANFIAKKIPEDRTYGYAPSSKGRHFLRKVQRKLHGYDENTEGSIHEALKESPLEKLNNGEDIEIEGINGEKRTIYGKDLKKRQESVQIFYDSNNITPQEVHDIQLIKAGLEIKAPDGKSLESYKAHLNQVARYVVIRGKCMQYHEYDGTLCAEPRERIEYYGCFPNMEFTHNPDYVKFCNEDYTLKEPTDVLKNVSKAVIRLHTYIGNENKEAWDIVTPNAFFSALEGYDKATNTIRKGSAQDKAKHLFAQALIEVAQEGKRPNFPGIFAHNDPSPEMHNTIEAARSSLKFPAEINPGDASAPIRAAKELNCEFKVAECIMSNPKGAAGHAALRNGANKAKEENDARVMGGEVQLIFGPQFNAALLNMDRYVGVPLSEKELSFEEAAAELKREGEENKRPKEEADKTSTNKADEVEEKSDEPKVKRLPEGEEKKENKDEPRAQKPGNKSPLVSTPLQYNHLFSRSCWTLLTCSRCLLWYSFYNYQFKATMQQNPIVYKWFIHRKIN